MGTTADKLNKVLETKEAIRTAINNKGGALTETDTFASYATAIDNIQSGGGGGGDNPLQYVIDNYEGDGKPSCYNLFYKYQGTSLDILSQCDFSKVTNMSYMFNGCSSLTTIPLIDTSSCTNMSNMFDNCSSLTTIPLIDTSSCINMSKMFTLCSKLTTIPQLDTSSCTNIYAVFNGCSSLTTIPQLDTSLCTNMGFMFWNCSKLTTIPQLDTSSCTKMYRMFFQCSSLTTIPQLDTSKVTDFTYMFYYCSKLTSIDITHMKITSTSYNSDFASYCYSLTKLIIRNMDAIPALSSTAFTNCYHFYGTKNATDNPEGLKDGRIYVPDDKVEALKTATNWSVFADIIVPLSTLVEE